MSNLNNEPEKKIPLRDLIKAANTFARLGVDYEVLSDYMKTPRFKKALERVSLIVPEEVLEGLLSYVFETPYFNKDTGEKHRVTFPVDPNSSPESESSSLNGYWVDVSKKPSFKVFQQELATISKNTLNDIPIEVIHLNNVIENIQTTLVSSDFKRDLLVLQNLKESEAEAFQSSYEQNAEHYRKETYLAESEREAQHNLKQALETARKIQSQNNNCQSEKQENLVKFQQQYEQIQQREFNHQQNLVKFEELQEKIKQEIENVAADCAQDATTLLNVNQELSNHLQEFTKKLYECERNSPKPRLPSEISQLSRFQKGFNQIFGWSVSFLIWPLALHDPDSDLWKLLAETSGIQIRRGPTGIIRGSTCQVMAVGLTMLWWLFLLTLVKQFLWDNRTKKNLNEKNLNASEMVEDSGKITKWKKFKQIIGRKVSQFLSVSDDGEIVDLTVPSVLRGGSETRQILEYPDFLLFVTIHAYKTCNLNVVAPAKSFQVKKYRSSLQSISDRLSRLLGIIGFVFLISSSQFSTIHQQRFLEVTPPIRISNNLTRSFEIYSNQSENQAESRIMRLAQAELEGESRMETQMENPKKNVRRKKFKKRNRMVKEKMKMKFSDRKFKKQKQVKKLSDLPAFENCQTDVPIESSGQSWIPERIRIPSHF